MGLQAAGSFAGYFAVNTLTDLSKAFKLDCWQQTSKQDPPERNPLALLVHNRQNTNKTPETWTRITSPRGKRPQEVPGPIGNRSRRHTSPSLSPSERQLPGKRSPAPSHLQSGIRHFKAGCLRN
ncbi:hypothetical protein AAFF_G00246220 [Aldrovandia affinis]|uniref:Uncharacterized protein n=1 Tax=Aldrovandia affinis TaxID=143900 RepID=A0AAD7SU12_9TELE|nr:hypothetical protein AAFF_G00246220 [Aldrovandia affinis]